MRALTLVMICVAARAQPTVSSIVSSGDLKSAISIEGLGTMFGANLADKAIAANSLPWPTKLGSTELFACAFPTFPVDQCTPLQLLYVSAKQINFYVGELDLHMGGSIFSNSLVIRINGIVTLLNFGLQMYQTAPIIFQIGYDCSIDLRDSDTSPCGLSLKQQGPKQVLRGAVADQSGVLVSSINPMRVGPIYSVYLTGLGSNANILSSQAGGIAIDDVPAYGYDGSTYVYANVYYAGNSSYPGLNQINLALPKNLLGDNKPGSYSPFPCADYRFELALSVQDSHAFGMTNFVSLPVLIKNGDVICSPSSQ